MAQNASDKGMDDFKEYISSFKTEINVGSPIDPITGELVSDFQKGPIKLSSAAIGTRAMKAYLAEMAARDSKKVKLETGKNDGTPSK